MLANKRLDTGGLKAAPAIRSTLSSLSSHNLQLLSMVSCGNLQVKAPEAKPEPPSSGGLISAMDLAFFKFQKATV